MTVQVPTDTTYYYETSTRGTRIVICIPHHEIKRRVNEEQVRPEIIDDYPDGLDFEVSSYELKYFANRYGLDIDIDPGALRAAFLAFTAQSPEPLPRTGFISAQFLDSIAGQARVVGAVGTPSTKASPGRRMADSRQRRRQQQLDLQESVSRQLGRESGFQLVPDVEMSEGEDVAQVLSRLQWRSGKGGG